MTDPLTEAAYTLRCHGWNGADIALAVIGPTQTLHRLGGNQGPAQWPVSTGATGFGNQQDSGRTPTGLHRVCACIGDGAPLGMVFKGRQATGTVVPESNAPGQDWITTRILWLQGLEPGVNQGPGVDSRDRFIYIHGTPQAARLGKPVSAGCVRMDNQHILALYGQVRAGTLVLIVAPDP